MFAVIYQSYLKPGRELEYRELWDEIARYFIVSRGSIGFCLEVVSDLIP